MQTLSVQSCLPWDPWFQGLLCRLRSPGSPTEVLSLGGPNGNGRGLKHGRAWIRKSKNRCFSPLVSVKKHQGRGCLTRKIPHRTQENSQRLTFWLSTASNCRFLVLDFYNSWRGSYVSFDSCDTLTPHPLGFLAIALFKSVPCSEAMRENYAFAPSLAGAGCQVPAQSFIGAGPAS